MEKDKDTDSKVVATSNTDKPQKQTKNQAKLKSATVKDAISRTRTMTGSRPDIININPVQEEAEKTAVMTFGRFNPPTIGHEKLIHAVRQTAEKHNGQAHIFASHSEGDGKNPIPKEKKAEYVKKVAGPGVTVHTSSREAPSLLHQAARLHAAGNKHLVMVAGSDRVKEYEKVLNKYNGVKAPHGHYNFKSIKVVSAGHRDPDAEGAEGMSGTKMRELARKGDEKGFKEGLPVALHPHAKEMMHQIHSVKEETFSQFDIDLREAIEGDIIADLLENFSVITEKAKTNIIEKAAKNGINEKVLLDLYHVAFVSARINDNLKITPEQYAFNAVNSYVSNMMFEKRGLWANIHAKRERIKRGSGKRMRSPGEKGAPTPEQMKKAMGEETMTDVNDIFEAEFKPTDREAMVRDTKSGLKTFKVMAQDKDRKNSSDMYRQQTVQKKIIDEATTTTDIPEYLGKMADERKEKKKKPYVARMARRAGDKPFVYRPVKEEDEREYDYEGDMAMSDLRSIIHNAQRIHDLLEPNTNLPEWCQSKITLAEDYISTVANYMTAEKGDVKEEAGCPIDEDMEIEELIEEDFIPSGLELYEDWGELEEEAEKGGRKVKLGKPFLTPGGPKKRAVYVKNDKGNVVKVNFGDPNMRIKKSDPERRKSFRARHNCDNPGPRHKARYWSCKAW